MLTGSIIFLLAIILFVFLFIYKKEMLIRVFTSNMSVSTNQFTEHLEQTADVIIRRLEEETAQLELLLEEAEIKIGMLSQQVEHANKIIEQMKELEGKREKAEFEKTRVGLISDNKLEVIPPEIEVEQATENIAEPAALLLEEASNRMELPIAEEHNIAKEPMNIEKYRHIITMTEQGYTVTEIAKATGLGKGEILLLLQLNK